MEGFVHPNALHSLQNGKGKKVTTNLPSSENGPLLMI
jgi:hypothetical protein